MNDYPFDHLKQGLRDAAGTLPYPPTPDVAGVVRQRLADRQPAHARPRQWSWAWAIVITLLLVGGLLAVPQVRAAVLEALRIGAIGIFTEPTPATSPAGEIVVSPTATALSLTAAVSEFAQPVTLAEAQTAVNFPLRLPSYPPDLGLPDQVYLHDVDWPAVIIMVWLKPAQPEEVWLSLYHIAAEDYGYKQAPIIEETSVNGGRALWMETPHFFRLRGDQMQPWFFVEGNVLIWTEQGRTYRLESRLSLEEAIRVAESLTDIP